MAKWARIVDDKVAEVIEFNPIGLFHPDIVWTEIPDSVEVNFVKSGSSYVAPAEPEVPEPPVPVQPTDATSPIGGLPEEPDSE